MLLLIDLTSYTTNMKNKILKKRLYIVDIKCKDRVIRKKVAKPVIYIKTDYLLQTNFV